MALALGCLSGKWPWPWGACWGRCLEGLDVLEGLDGFGGCLEGLEGFGGFGGFGGCLEDFGEFWTAWSVCGLANGSFESQQYKAIGVALALGWLFEKWPWPWGACGGRCLEGLNGFGGFDTFASP